MKSIWILKQRMETVPSRLVDANVARSIDHAAEVSDPNEWHDEIVKLSRRLDRRSSVRRLAEAILRDEETPLAAIIPAFRALALKPGLNWREQEVAAWALGSVKLNAEQKRIAAEALLPLLDRLWSLDLRSRLKIAISRLCLISLPAALWLYDAGGYLVSSSTNSVLAHSIWFEPLIVAPFTFTLCATVLAPIVLPISYVLDDRQRNRVRARAITAMGRLKVPHGLEGTLRALVEASSLNIGVGSGRIRTAAHKALPNMVEALTPDHYGRMSADTVPQLCQLCQNADVSLTHLALRALAVVGDGRAIPAVERLRDRARTAELRQEAEALLPILIQRQQDDNAPHILLRAAGAPQARRRRAADALHDVASTCGAGWRH